MFTFAIINNPLSFALDVEKIGEIAENVSREVPLPQNGIINIAFISDEEMQKLNLEYRWIDKTTDVLSFHYFDDFSLVNPDDIAGEIVMSESKIIEQSHEHEHSEWKETQVLVLHGLLHILGFDHEEDSDFEEMWKYESLIREKLFAGI